MDRIRIFEQYALKNVDLTIRDGEFIGLIGHTGSGKSTLTQHLNGLLKASSGDILYNGESIYREGFSMKELRSHVGLVFQYPEHQLFRGGCAHRRMLWAEEPGIIPGGGEKPGQGRLWP